jgi:hypothetical protein
MPRGYLSSEKNMIALGRMHKVSSVHKFGGRTGILNGSAQTIWDGTGVYPWGSFGWSDISTPLTVTGASDAGKSITIFGLNGNWDEISETIVVGASSTLAFKRVNRAYVEGTNVNAGDISVTRGAVEVLKISEGKGQTLMATYTIPRNHTGLLQSIEASASADKDMKIEMYIRNSENDAFRIQHMGNVFRGQYSYEFAIPLALPATADIDVRVIGYSVDTNAQVACSFDIINYEEATDY